MYRTRTLYFYRNRLPHWEVENGTYFLTMRVYGTLPVRMAQRLKQVQQEYREEDNVSLLQKKIMYDTEKWLDNLKNDRHLKDPSVAQSIVSALVFRQEQKIWDIHEFVVMPNHVHLLFNIVNGSLKPAMISFKRWTAGQAMKLLGLKQRHFWQEDWFDHWVRSHEEYLGLVEYIRMNPVKAGLVKRTSDWPYVTDSQPDLQR